MATKLVDYTLTRRYELSGVLRQLLVDAVGFENATYLENGQTRYKVYFQPGETVIMRYPCIVYEMKTGDTEFADDGPYRFTKRYDVTVIDKNPDSVIPYHVAMLQMCKADRTFPANNLNHFTFNLYY